MPDRDDNANTPSFTLSDLLDKQDEVLEAVERVGLVNVVDEQGEMRFQMSLPTGPAPDFAQ